MAVGRRQSNCSYGDGHASCSYDWRSVGYCWRRTRFDSLWIEASERTYSVRWGSAPQGEPNHSNHRRQLRGDSASIRSRQPRPPLTKIVTCTDTPIGLLKRFEHGRQMMAMLYIYRRDGTRHRSSQFWCICSGIGK